MKILPSLLRTSEAVVDWPLATWSPRTFWPGPGTEFDLWEEVKLSTTIIAATVLLETF